MKFRDVYDDNAEERSIDDREHIEKRKHKRVSLSSKRQFTAVLFQKGKYALIRGKNISNGGLRAVLLENSEGIDFSIDDVVDMHLAFGGSAIHPMKAQISWSTDTHIGVEFIEPSLMSKVALEDYVDSCMSTDS